MKKIFTIISVLFLFSCSSKDEQFCACLKAGDELNQFSSELFTKEIGKEDADKLKDLKNKKKQECKNYQTMKGPEMLEKKSSCTN